MRPVRAGVELRARYTFFAEGARGSLSKQLIERFGLRELALSSRIPGPRSARYSSRAYVWAPSRLMRCGRRFAHW